jgi:dipeptidyl aminopeptidase/acylaminoacyl peptidase
MKRPHVLTSAIAGCIGIMSWLLIVYPQGALKPSPGFADYGQWETLLGAPRGGLSPDGRWLAYSINRSNGNNELRIQKLSDGETKTVAFGTSATFSADSKWIAYSIGYSESETAKAPPNAPLQAKLGLMNLATGEMATIDGIQSFALSPDGAYVVMRRYAPRPATPPGPGPAPGRGGEAATTEPEAPVGITVIVRQLSSGRDATFGNVAESVWRDTDKTHLLAMAISAESKTGNGVHLFDPETATLHVLDSSSAVYSGLTWRKDSTDLAAFRARTDDRHDGANEVVLAWTGLAGSEERLRIYDASTDSAFPQDLRVVSFRRPSWSDDGKVLFFGVATWNLKKAPAGARGGTGGGDSTKTAEEKPATSEEEAAAVDIWHWTDVMVQPRQKLSATTDRRRNTLAAWHINTGKFVQLSKDAVNEQVSPIRHSNYALVTEWSKYAMDRTIGRPAADLFVQDVSTGMRTRLKDGVNDRYVQVSPGGKYALFLENDHFWTIDLATRAIVNVTRSASTSFIDKESDATTKQKPAFGVAGWTKDDAAVLLYDKFDLWQVAADGSKPVRLTAGTAEQARYRLLRLDPQADDPAIDISKPQYLSVFGIVSKKSGYARLRPASSSGPRTADVEKLVWLDKSVGSIGKAKDAEVYSYVSQDYDDSPDLFVGADPSSARQATNTNPFQEKFAWGKSEIVEFTGEKGLKLQAALYYPSGYERGKQYPMIVNIYEQLSDNVHRYVSPSDRDYYNISVFTTNGYFVLQPDIVFSPRQPGISVVQCVTAAIKKVTSMGAIDPKRVGVVGHSWGGFDTAYLSTHTTGIFAAAVAGAPITDLVSNYGNHHWNSGIAETDHIETGQQRMEVPLWEDLQEYISNSAVFNAQNMTVPLLIEVGDSDGTVFWHQGVELFNIARRAGKNVVLLQYNGEDHGLRQKKNQVDYQRRILAWFGHYLKGDVAEKWITSGESYLDRQEDLKKLTTKK